MGFFLVDLLCTGIKNAFYRINMPASEYGRLIESFDSQNTKIQTCTYELVHNIIYEGLAYASELGIEPVSKFALASLILEEDSDDIPLINIPVGEGGLPLLMLHPGDQRNAYYKHQLASRLNPDQYRIVEHWEIDEWDEPEEEGFNHDFSTWSYKQWDDFLKNFGKNQQLVNMDKPQIVFIYKNCIYNSSDPETIASIESTYSLPNHIEVSFNTLNEENYSQEELELISDIWDRMMIKNPSSGELEKVKKQLSKAIKKWPGNPIFLNLLTNAHLLLREGKIAKQLINQTVTDFPNYFSGKIMKIKWMMEDGEMDEVSKLLKDIHTIADFAPERKLFHITELINFYSLICQFNVYQGKSKEAYFCYLLAAKLEEMVGTSHFQNEIVALVLEEIFKEVMKLITDIQLGKKQKVPIIKLLLAGD